MSVACYVMSVDCCLPFLLFCMKVLLFVCCLLFGGCLLVDLLLVVECCLSLFVGRCSLCVDCLVVLVVS